MSRAKTVNNNAKSGYSIMHSRRTQITISSSSKKPISSVRGYMPKERNEAVVVGRKANDGLPKE